MVRGVHFCNFRGRMRDENQRSLGKVVLLLLTAAAMSSALAQGPASPPRSVTMAKDIFEAMVRGMSAEREKQPWDKRRDAQNPYDMLEVPIEDWTATEEGRFAHAIRIPNPVPEDSGYRPGMSQREYFEHLCSTEAGEFIFKTADDVAGLYQMRPRRIYSHGEWQHLYALEDPYGYWRGEHETIGQAFQLATPSLYAFLELPAEARRRYALEWHRLVDKTMLEAPPPGAKVARYLGYNGQVSNTMRLEYDTKQRARYGFTWRGVKRPMDREMGIAGGELIVLDLQTMEVMGVRRGYNVWNGEWTSRVCPKYGYLGGSDRSTFFTAWFVAKVARPSNWQEFIAGFEKTKR